MFSQADDATSHRDFNNLFPAFRIGILYSRVILSVGITELETMANKAMQADAFGAADFCREDMKNICLAIVAALLLTGSSSGEDTVRPYEPEISLFQSVQIIKEYLKSEAKQEYSDKYLNSVRHHYSEGHPRKGPCCLYSFAFKKPRIGGNISIYHFMDGEIIEFNHGP